MSGLPAGVPHRFSGRRRVEVTEPLRLGGTGRAAAVAVRFLRECQSLGLRVHWRAAGPRTAYDVRDLRHLPPPAEVPGEPGEWTAWRAGYAHGMLYHRRGPGFVAVLDRRDPGTATRLTLDHPGLLATFGLLQEPTRLDALDTTGHRALGLLTTERLALVTDGWAVSLPPRVHRWPVPCTAI
ncbi:DUF5825 family protein [Streptomyces sp. NPDC006739]|uniref:DUF5825 family protein n=1 Tax=Streptomyces sp. NPDC006739 TaxID=3364763 RepID=UPI0036BD9CE8